MIEVPENPVTENVPTPQVWYCPSCKKMRSKEYPDGKDTVLGVQHGDTLIIKHKDLRIEIEAEGRIGMTCRVCGAYIEIYSQDWIEVKKFKARLAKERASGGPPIKSQIVIH
jgi:hypothetical protein